MVNKIHIAIADDHAVLRRGLTIILEALKGFQVDIEAANGIELLEKISKAEIKPGICLLDISMPLMNGYDTLVALKKSWPDIKVIILTVSYTEYTIIKTLADGASACLPKELEENKLAEAILHVHNHGIYHSDSDEKFLTSSMLEKNKKIKLSKNEIAYLQFACSPLTHREISNKMGVSDRTIDSYRDALCDKLGLKNRIELVIFAIESGIRLFGIIK